MSNDPDRDIAALGTLVVFLMQQIKDVTARAEALRCLLVWRGTFSQDEYDKMYAKALAEWDRAMGVAMTEATKAAIDAALQQMLERHEGTKQ